MQNSWISNHQIYILLLLLILLYKNAFPEYFEVSATIFSAIVISNCPKIAALRECIIEDSDSSLLDVTLQILVNFLDFSKKAPASLDVKSF
jgi:hypothetical protein